MIIPAWFQSPVMEMLGWVLLHSLWQITLIAAACAAVLAWLRRRSPNVRYVLACAALVGMAACPAGTFIFMYRGVSMRLTLPVAIAMPVQMHAAAAATAGDLTSPQSTAPSSASVPHTAPMPDWKNLLLPGAVLLYLSGLTVLAMRLLLGHLRLRSLVRRARAVDEKLTAMLAAACHRLQILRHVRLLQSSLVEVPTLIGALRPVVLFPAVAITGLPAEQIELLLAHELAHIRRHDYLLNLVQSVIETLLFYHPAVWWLSARIRQEREYCCDDIAAGPARTNRLAYVRALEGMESMRATPAYVPANLAVAAGGGTLLPRVRRMVLPAASQDRPASGACVAAVALGALMTGFYLIGCAGHEPSADRHAHTAQVSTAAQSTATASTPTSAGAAERRDDIRRQKVMQLVADAQKLFDQAQFKEAADLLKQATIIDPQDKSAALLFREVNDKITASDLAFADGKVQSDLEDSLEYLDITSQSLEKVIDYLQNNLGDNIIVNWPALRIVGIDNSTQVTNLKLRHVSFREAIAEVLKQVNEATKPHSRVSFMVIHGSVFVSTADDLAAPAKGLALQIPVESRILVLPENIMDDFRVGWSLKPEAGGKAGDDTSSTGCMSIIDNWTVNMLLKMAADTQSQVLNVAAQLLEDGKKSGFEIAAESKIATQPSSAAATKPREKQSSFPVTARFEVIAKVSQDRRYAIFTEAHLVLTPVTAAPPAAAAPTSSPAPREFHWQPVSVPTGGTLLIDAGAIVDPSDHASHRVLIMIRTARPTEVEVAPTAQLGTKPAP